MGQRDRSEVRALTGIWQEVSAGWLAQIVDQERHVTPVNDLRPHTVDSLCWCKPFDDDGVTVHNSLDGREEFERGRRMS